MASLAIVGTCGCGREGGVSESLPWLLPSVLFVFVIQVNTSHTGGAIPVPVLVEGSFQVLAEGPPAALHSETLSVPKCRADVGGFSVQRVGATPTVVPLAASLGQWHAVTVPSPETFH